VSTSRIIAQLKEVKLRSPAEIIIQQLRDLLSAGVLKPGDRLPSERELAERFRVGRGYVREALRRLEFYGILQTVPNRGTIVASLGVKALEGLMANLLALDRHDLQSLLETRAMLEVHSVWLAAQRATDDEIAALGELHEKFRGQVEAGAVGLEEDIAFHFKIAESSKNSVLRSLLSLICPEIIEVARRYQTCREGRAQATLGQHRAMLAHLARRDAEAAADAMATHMQQFLDAVISGLQLEGRTEARAAIAWPPARLSFRAGAESVPAREAP